MAALSARFRLLATAVLAAAVAGCGSGGIGGTIPPQNAATLRADAAAVRAAVAARDCSAASAGISQLEDDVNALPKTSGLGLKDGLRTLIANLQQLVKVELGCGSQAPTGASGIGGFQPPPTTSSTTGSTTSTSSTTSEQPPPGRSGAAPGHQKPKPPPQPNGGPGGGTGGIGPGGDDG